MKKLKQTLLVVAILILIIILPGCGKNKYGDSSKITNYDVEYVFLHSGDVYEYDPHKQFKNSNVKITNFNFAGASGNIVAYRENYIVAANPGIITLHVEFYDKNTRSNYIIPNAIYIRVIPKITEMKEINSSLDFNNIRNDLDGFYLLNNNINLSNYQDWTPIGNHNNNFTGIILNPNNYIIENISINEQNLLDQGYCGIFGVTKNAYFENLIINNLTINSLTSYDILTSYYGGLISYSTNTIVNNCKINGNINSTAHSGGIIGYADNRSLIIDSSFTGTIINTSQNLSKIEENKIYQFNTTGGVIGYALQSRVINSFSNATLTSEHIIGGIIGCADNSIYSKLQFNGIINNVPNNQLICGYIPNDKK